MRSVRKLASWAARWGLLGFVSGLLSCLMSQSFLLYRDQKTLDHIVWPGLVFALVVLLPLSRWAGDGPLRTAAALIASFAAYPIAWSIAAFSTEDPGVYMVGAFALAGLLGSSMLAGAVLFRRRHWVRGASATVILGTLIGALMGANLLAATTGMDLLGSTRDGLGVFLVVWQTVVGASLARAVLPQPNEANALNTDGATVPDDSGAESGSSSLR